MRRTIALISVLCLAGLLLAACSNDNAPMDPTALDKKPPVLPPPPPGSYLYQLQEAFDDLTFLPVTITVNTAGGTFEGTSATYTSATPIQITLPETGEKDEGELVTCTIWVPAAPASGYLDIPGNCILFKTQNLPEVPGEILVHIPLMRWNVTSTFTDSFNTFRLAVDDDGVPYRKNPGTFSLPAWPPINSNETVYVTSAVPPGTGEPSTLTDDVVEPDELGGEL